jgi:hypothetical protein
MTTLVDVLHIATLNGSLVRLFPPPGDQPDMPWHSIDDLAQCCGLSEKESEFLARKVLRHRQTLETVATPFGLVRIAPHFMAQGLIGAMILRGDAPKHLEHDYNHAVAAALMKLVPQPIVRGSPWFVFLREQVRGRENDPDARAALPAGFLDDDDAAEADNLFNHWFRKVIDPSDADGYHYDMTKEGVIVVLLQSDGSGNATAKQLRREFLAHYQAMSAKLGAQQRDIAHAVWTHYCADPQSPVVLVELIQQFENMETMLGPGADTLGFWQHLMELGR